MATELAAALEEIEALDHHAHPLSGPGVTWSLPDLLSESAEADQRAQMRHHPSFHRALAALGASDETAWEEARRDAGFDAHAKALMSACRFEGVFIDDGFPVAGALDAGAHADLAGCPVGRLVRIESVVERAARGWPSFEAMREWFRDSMAGALADGAVGLKTIAAYRCGLDLPRPEEDETRSAYRAWRASGSRRLTHPALIAYFLAEALEVARTHGPVPLQIHTGVGDADLDLSRADPSLLGPVIAAAGAAGVPVVLLHCYPYVRQAAWLAHVYGHVYVDLSLSLLLIGHRGGAVLSQALELAPATKVLFATDASRAPEMFFLASRWWRDSLAGVLDRLVGERTVGEATALEWAQMILAGNARRLYGLGERGAAG
ncbi:MAG: amidohydrolase family protein [Acidimicrobiia bacterium]